VLTGKMNMKRKMTGLVCAIFLMIIPSKSHTAYADDRKVNIYCLMNDGIILLFSDDAIVGRDPKNPWDKSTDFRYIFQLKKQDYDHLEGNVIKRAFTIWDKDIFYIKETSKDNNEIFYELWKRNINFDTDTFIATVHSDAKSLYRYWRSPRFGVDVIDDGKKIIVGIRKDKHSWYELFKIVNATTGVIERNISPEGLNVYDYPFCSPNGKYIAGTGDRTGTSPNVGWSVAIWDIEKNEEIIITTELGKYGYVYYSIDGDLVWANIISSRRLKIFSMQSDNKIRVLSKRTRDHFKKAGEYRAHWYKRGHTEITEGVARLIIENEKKNIKHSLRGPYGGEIFMRWDN